MKVSHLLLRIRSMNNIHALVRSIITYAVCIPLAAVIGYMLTKPLSFSEAAMYCILLTILVFPLLAKYHYPLMLACWSMPISLFFIKTSPSIGMVMMVISFGISVFDRILARQTKFITVPELILPLIVMALVVIFTAELTGGIGLRSLGGDVYGGKKYVFLFVGILGYFALVARPIPPEKAKLYISLYLLGGVLSIISDLASILPGGLRFIYLLIPASGVGSQSLATSDFAGGVSRLPGTGSAALTVFMWMLAYFGVRGLLITKSPWRTIFFVVAFCTIGLGGYRSAIMQSIAIFGILFYMARLHRTPMLFVFILAAVVLAAGVLPFASRLPMVMQRSLAFLPLDLSPEALQSAQGSTDWRVNLWSSVAQEIPKYFFVGKGYSISMEDWTDIEVGNTATYGKISGEDEPLAISGDFHNGPLSVIIPFGIWGVLAFLWIVFVCIWVLFRNYRYGLPAFRLINSFLLAQLLVKLLIFLTVFGAMQNDIGSFMACVGFSVALNNGVAKPTGQTVQSAVSRFHPGGGMVRTRPAMARQSIPG